MGWMLTTVGYGIGFADGERSPVFAEGMLLVSARVLAVGIAAAVVLLAAIGTAQAKPSHGTEYEIQRANVAASLYLGKKGGYRVGLYLPNERTALFYVYKIKRAGERSAYFVNEYAVHNQGSLAHGAIRARFGSLGSFSLRFRPSGDVRADVEEDCEGRPGFTEYGRFVGHAAFHGERGFLHFAISSGAGAIAHSFRLKCEKGRRYPPEPPRSSLRAYVAPGSFFSVTGNIALLYASAHKHGRYVGVTAGHHEEEPPGAQVRIGVLESRGKMAIGRYGLLYAGPGTLLTSLPGVHPATATLAPPAPFFGAASYQQKAADSRSWTGTLGVELPGLRLPLTGPGFHTRLCVLNPLKAPRSGCDFFKAPPPPPDERPALRLGWSLR